MVSAVRAPSPAECVSVLLWLASEIYPGTDWCCFGGKVTSGLNAFRELNVARRPWAKCSPMPQIFNLDGLPRISTTFEHVAAAIVKYGLVVPSKWKVVVQ